MSLCKPIWETTRAGLSLAIGSSQFPTSVNSPNSRIRVLPVHHAITRQLKIPLDTLFASIGQEWSKKLQDINTQEGSGRSTREHNGCGFRSKSSQTRPGIVSPKILPMRTISRLTDRVVSKPCTVDQLAEYLDATPRFVRNEIAAGRLRARRLSARLIRILPSDLQQWLDASATTPVNNKP
jgi:excisionase family DNA binding protein